MSTDAMKALTRRAIEEGWNQGKLEVFDEVDAPEYVDHAPAPGQGPGVEGYKQAVQMTRAAFPDLQITVEDMIAEGDLVVTRWTARGTHQGEYMGIPASGKSVQVTGVNIGRFENGKVVENWANSDQLGLLQQLGVLPAPGQG